MIKLLSPKSGVGRTVRGFLQAIVGLSGFFSLAIADPTFYQFVSSSPYATVLTSGTFIAFVVALHNFLEWLIPKLYSQDTQDPSTTNQTPSTTPIGN